MRLLTASKSLFARLGYEQTSTAAIAREAGTSESQLVRYFETKAGLLRAIFDESWKPLNERLESLIANAQDGRQAMLEVAATVVLALGHDPEFAFLLLLEGRRVRGPRQEIILSKGFLAFEEQIKRLVLRGQEDGSFSKAFSHAAIAAAVFGATEGMVRDRVLAERTGNAVLFSELEIQRVLSALLDGLCPAGTSGNARPRRDGAPA